MTDNIPSDMTKKGSSTQNRTRHKHHITNSRLALFSWDKTVFGTGRVYVWLHAKVLI